MHTALVQRIQKHRQRCHQGFAFTGFHFGDLTFVQGDAAHQLHIKMALTKCSLRGFANQCKCFSQQIIFCFALCQTVTQLTGHGAQRLIIKAAQPIL